MISIAPDTLAQYDAVLKKRAIPATRQADYKKWLRYFLDYCGKYPVPDSKSERVRLFVEKLREKKQTTEQQKQAAHAVSLYFEVLKPRKNSPQGAPILSAAVARQCPAIRKPSRFSEPGYDIETDSPAWDKVVAGLAAEIKTRHYSRSTLKTYALWTRQFQRFLKNKPPQDLSTVDVREYLTYLAVKCNVSASTQNQAFNSLLFVFRHVLKNEFGDLRDVPHSMRRSRTPSEKPSLRSAYHPAPFGIRLPHIFSRRITTSERSRKCLAIQMSGLR
jgi:hypothetical protein